MAALGIWWRRPSSVPTAASLASSGRTAPPGRAAPPGAPAPDRTTSVRRVDAARVRAVLADLRAGWRPPKARMTASTDSPGMPACAPPPIPAATYPPGNSLRRPVPGRHHQWPGAGRLRRVDRQPPGLEGGQEDLRPLPVAVEDLRHHRMGDGTAPAPEPDGRDPAAGRRVLRNQGGASCLSADWPAGECIQIEAQYGPSPASDAHRRRSGALTPKAPPAATTRPRRSSAFPTCVSLTPSGTTTLTVTGVEPDGALDPR